MEPARHASRSVALSLPKRLMSRDCSTLTGTSSSSDSAAKARAAQAASAEPTVVPRARHVARSCASVSALIVRKATSGVLLAACRDASPHRSSGRCGDAASGSWHAGSVAFAMR